MVLARVLARLSLHAAMAVAQVLAVARVDKVVVRVQVLAAKAVRVVMAPAVRVRRVTLAPPR
jgi:hypothetical protein